jgi:hypothetical protein
MPRSQRSLWLRLASGILASDTQIALIRAAVSLPNLNSAPPRTKASARLSGRCQDWLQLRPWLRGQAVVVCLCTAGAESECALLPRSALLREARLDANPVAQLAGELCVCNQVQMPLSRADQVLRLA